MWSLFQINNGLVGPISGDLSCQPRGFRIGIPIRRDGGFPLLRQHNFTAEKFTFASSLRCQDANLVVSRGHSFGARITIEVKRGVTEFLCKFATLCLCKCPEPYSRVSACFAQQSPNRSPKCSCSLCQWT